MHAHAAGEGGIDVERLLGNPPATFRLHVAEGTHVVQPVGELDEKHAHVVGNREQQLAQVLGLLGFLGDEVELFQLCQAIDERADVGAEHLVDFAARGRRVFDRVMQ